MLRAALYARYSTDRQKAVSIDDQLAADRTYCARAGIGVALVFTDSAVSGASTLDRDGFQQLMLAARQRAFDVVVIESISRAFRNQADYHAARKILGFLDIEIHTIAGRLGDLEGSVTAMVAEQQLVDLAQQVRRGMSGAVKRGQHVGPPAFGYKLLPPVAAGGPGVLAVDEQAAEIVLRIFRDYLAGAMPRSIAISLNTEGVKGPRGGFWHSSAILGSRKRANGILHNALYDGRIVFNRQRFKKNPETNTRVSRPNERSEWIEAGAEHLRIVDRATFRAVQAMREDRGGEHAYSGRAKYMLSGLVKCGSCGGNYIVASTDKRGKVMRCAAAYERRGCSNSSTLAVRPLEDRVIAGIETHLGDPDLVSHYVRAFHKRANEVRASRAHDRDRDERRLQDVRRSIAQLIKSLEDGVPARTVKERLTELEGDRARLEAALDAAPVEPIRLHPEAAEAYRRRIAGLRAAIEDLRQDRPAEAHVAIRALLDKVVVWPKGRYIPPELELHGQLAALLRVSERAAAAPRSMGAMVAGDRFARDHRLPPIVVRLRSA